MISRSSLSAMPNGEAKQLRLELHPVQDAHPRLAAGATSPRVLARHAWV